MAVFRYSLQSILDIKIKMETQAKQEFGAARNALSAEQEILEEFCQRKEFYEQNAAQLLTGALRVREIEENQNAILHMEQNIRMQRERVRVAEEKVEAAREHLAEIARDIKTHEALKEKAFEEYILEENRAESKAVDELTSYTYGKRKAGE